MRRLIVVAASLSVGLAGFVGAVSAQEVPPEVIVTDASGTSAASNSALNPTASGEGSTIIYGDINTGGANRTVLAPPTVIQSGGAPPAAPAPEPAPAVDTTAAAPADTTAAVATETDLDADNYPDASEAELGLDPGLADTDGDGLADGDELNIYGTEPTIFDGDGDGASDGEELFGSLTDPLVWNDFTAASTETVAQQSTLAPQTSAASDTALLAQTTTENLTATNGNVSALGTGNASSAPGTITRDGYTVPSILGPDGAYSVTETSPPLITVGANAPAPAAPVETDPAPVAEPVAEPVAAEPIAAETAVATTEDLDADNYPDTLEWELGLDGNNPDSDADGVADGDELDIYGTDPLTYDSDGDGIADGEELFGILTDPLVWDTNGDGVGDGL